ncbi:MAG: JAB domain-containing protein [Castellaniella sp.]|uniref:RadC family protein n=1 Tax=Castellaniella sp. TaxID=1955812 RepID=UPI0012058538|nr:DNA repair protein RadC [Castellaniella sp.]TAN30305.1 MAG: JAB domain-containing protein [Castellaniella sp.]
MPQDTVSPCDERPRERLLRHGAHVLTSAELLAILLRTGTRGRDAVTMGRELIAHFGGLRPLLAAESVTLLAFPGLGAAKTCELLAVQELGRRSLEEPLRQTRILNQPERVKEFCAMRLAHLRVEHCIALFLDTQLQLIDCVEIARGTLSQASIYPREVVKAALAHHAAALILAHNHPSGLAEPSPADVSLTHQLKQALALVDVRLLDHLVVGATEVSSLAERGQI